MGLNNEETNYILELCEICNQMTNHKHPDKHTTICLKCGVGISKG